MKKYNKIIAALLAICLTLFVGCVNVDKSYKWKNDENYHWKVYSDGKTSEKAAHEFLTWSVKTPATETTYGEKVANCAVCGYTATESIPPTGDPHKGHTQGNWQSDAQNHWKVCSCGEIVQKAEHSFGEWTSDGNGKLAAVCQICGYQTTKDADVTNPHEGHTQSDWQSDAQSHWKVCSCGEKIETTAHVSSNWITDEPATQSTEGKMHKECITCQAILQNETIEQLTSAARVADFYAINDFHGETNRMSTVAGYLAEVYNQNANTVLINSGDMFQGSMESNSNYGMLLSDCMDYIGFDSFTLGNHEFDWGLAKLEALSEDSYTPFLGANVYHWDATTRKFGTFASELAQEYVVKTLPNGLKIGIIGVIGKDQITSISSNLVQTIGFKDPAEIIPDLSEKLRNQEGCDVIVVSAHTGPETFLENSSFDITQYADIVFCAHTHVEEIYKSNGVVFIQGGSYGRYVSHVGITVDENGNVSCDIYENIAYSDEWPNKVSVGELIDNSNEQIAEEANEVLAKLQGGYLSSGSGVPNLVCHAIANYVEKKYSDKNVVLAMVNTGRNSLEEGEITYTELYEAIPFDNIVYIARVSGADIWNEARYNSIWRISGEAIINSDNVFYNIAVIDYLLYHQNSNREYNYFRSAFDGSYTPIALENDNYDIYNYRLITRDFLTEQGSIDYTTYYGYNLHTDKNSLGQTVVFEN